MTLSRSLGNPGSYSCGNHWDPCGNRYSQPSRYHYSCHPCAYSCGGSSSCCFPCDGSGSSSCSPCYSSRSSCCSHYSSRSRCCSHYGSRSSCCSPHYSCSPHHYSSSCCLPPYSSRPRCYFSGCNCSSPCHSLRPSSCSSCYSYGRCPTYNSSRLGYCFLRTP